MRKTKTEQVPATTREVQTAIICDLCGGASHTPEDWADWRSDDPNTEEPEVCMRSGNVWPEGGMGKTTSFDICPACFEDKLIPWLKEQGAEPTITDWDY